MSGTVEVPGTAVTPVVWDEGLEALVQLSGALATGSSTDLDPWLRAAAEHAEPLEVEEVLLQSYLFLGFPTSLNALARWRSISGREAPVEQGGDEGVRVWAARGEETCRAVYGAAYDMLRDNIASMKPEMERWMLIEGYGKVLSRPGLSLGRRECCIAAILAVQDVPVQLRSHVRGALRCGADEAVVRAVLEAIETLQDPVARSHTRETLDRVLSSAGGGS